jgi:uncharacterized integral membrane protein
VSQVIVFLALAFSILIAVFAVQNSSPVPFQFLAYRAESVPLSVLVLISAALGAAAMLLLGLAREVSLRWRQRSISQQLRQAQARVTELETAAGAKQPTAVPAEPSAIGPPTEATPTLPAATRAPPREPAER